MGRLATLPAVTERPAAAPRALDPGACENALLRALDTYTRATRAARDAYLAARASGDTAAWIRGERTLAHTVNTAYAAYRDTVARALDTLRPTRRAAA